MGIEIDDTRGGRPVVNLKELAEESGMLLETDSEEVLDSGPVQTSVPEEAPVLDPVQTSVPEEAADLQAIGLGEYRPLRPLKEELDRPAVPPREVDASPPPAPVYQAPQPCARCGHRPGDVMLDPPTDADKTAFVEAALGNRPYEKRYRLLNNKLTITFEAGSHDEYAAAQALTAKKAVLGHFRTPEEIVAFTSTVKAASALRRVETGGGADDYAPLPLPENRREYEQLMAYDAAVARRVKEIGMRFHIILQAAVKFEDNYRTLLTRALNETF
jgi:hypothetical protein